MENLSNLLKDLRDRISNPFLISFIIAWCTINWKIIIGLLFYKNEQLKIDGYSSFIDLISKSHNNKNFLMYPILIALLYTFGFPLFKNLISAFNHWVNAWGINWNMRISKSRTISIEKYMQLRNTYEDRTALLEDIVKKESILINQNEEFTNQILELKTANNSLAQRLKEWAFVNNPQVLDGRWRYSYTTPTNKELVIYEVQIQGNQFEIIDLSKKMNIQNFYNHLEGNTISFMLQNSKNDYEFFNFRKIDNDLDVLRGTTNRNKEVELLKRK